MKTEAQRIAIAMACPSVARIDGAGAPVWIRDSREYFDPLTDLNAMHEAEKALTREQQNIYAGYLMRIVRNAVGSPHWCLVHAAAAQRAEAFLRTIGEWTED